MDRVTRAEIERIAAATLRDAGLTEPPLSVEKLLQYVQLHRDYYDLANPGFLDRAKHKLRIDGHKLVDIINKVRLQAVLLFDENRICIDQELPKIKHPWASCHETGHRLLPWHKPFFFGDTAQTLDPNYQADLEAEANYAAGRLLFLGNRFTEEAKDLVPTIKVIKSLAKRYRASLTTTLRRYVEQGPDFAMAMLVSTPPWSKQPAGQEHRWRHFIPSGRFSTLFPEIAAESLRTVLDEHVAYRRGGKVAEFRLELVDARGDRHELRAWSFNNQYYLLTLFVEERRVTDARIVMSGNEFRSVVEVDGGRGCPCKYPPAKPGALAVSRSKRPAETWPLRGHLSHPPGGYSGFNRSCSKRRSSRPWSWMYARIACSSRPTVDTKYPRAQKCCPTKFRGRPAKFRAM